MTAIGGTLIVHNGFKFDYCFQAAIESLLALCDEVVVVDAVVGKIRQSRTINLRGDGTSEWLAEKASSESRLKIIRAQWAYHGQGIWLRKLYELARENLTTPFHVSLQADEVLHEHSFPEIRQKAAEMQITNCIRHNFWMDHRHTLPPHRHVAPVVCRVAPATVPFVLDAESINPWINVPCGSNIQIFHYGFIRHALGFVAKSKPMGQSYTCKYDPILDSVASNGMKELLNPEHYSGVPVSELVPFTGTHPRFTSAWLTSHGYI